jgi:hypothetical protein
MASRAQLATAVSRRCFSSTNNPRHWFHGDIEAADSQLYFQCGFMKVVPLEVCEGSHVVLWIEVLPLLLRLCCWDAERSRQCLSPSLVPTPVRLPSSKLPTLLLVPRAHPWPPCPLPALLSPHLSPPLSLPCVPVSRLPVLEALSVQSVCDVVPGQVSDPGVQFGADTAAAVSAAIVNDVAVHHTPNKYIRKEAEITSSWNAIFALLALCPRA